MSASVAGTKNVEVIGLYKNHFNMIQFASTDDEDYTAVSSHIRLMVQGAPSTPTGAKLMSGKYQIRNVRSMAVAALRESANSNVIAVVPELDDGGGDVVSPLYVTHASHSRSTVEMSFPVGDKTTE